MQRIVFLCTILCTSCEVQDAPKPISVEKLTKSYSINHLPHTGVFNPQYLPNLRK